MHTSASVKDIASASVASTKGAQVHFERIENWERPFRKLVAGKVALTPEVRTVRIPVYRL